MRVFVAGAAGALGSHVVRRLVADGHDVTGLTRTPAHAERIIKAGAQAVVGNALAPVWSKISNALKRLGLRSRNFLA
jgi:nucleoside-diphosphate-sugar epimerase